MAKVVQKAVYLRGENGEAAWFVPGDELPAWASKVVPKGALEPYPDQVQAEAAQARRQRIQATDESGDDTADDNSQNDEGDPFFIPLPEDITLDDLSHKELDVLLEERNLATSGNLDEKVTRLETYDASQS